MLKLHQLGWGFTANETQDLYCWGSQVIRIQRPPTKYMMYTMHIHILPIFSLVGRYDDKGWNSVWIELTIHVLTIK